MFPKTKPFQDVYSISSHNRIETNECLFKGLRGTENVYLCRECNSAIKNNKSKPTSDMGRSTALLLLAEVNLKCLDKVGVDLIFVILED